VVERTAPPAPSRRAPLSPARAAGWLPAGRAAALAALRVDCRPDRGAAERAWDAFLTELLAVRRARGDARVPAEYGRAPRLAALLGAARAAWAAGGLPPGAAAQLAALGVEPRAGRGARGP
jgi:hypothetical protein